MFESLSSRLNTTIRNLSGRGRLTDKNMRESLKEVKSALLEADVALPIVKSFVKQVQSKAVGQAILAKVSPGEALVKIVHDELVLVMGEKCERLNLSATPPAVVLMAGLQGSGKTTTVAKLARWLKEHDKKKVMVVSCDVYRPAAIDQLQTLAEEIEVIFHPSSANGDPVEIAKAAIADAKVKFADVVLVDTAGRLHIDADMMQEIQAIHAAINPVETLFVVDSMTGQDAAVTAKAFNEALPITGVVLTKTDGDARGGAALSIRKITGKPIKFLGVGEKTDGLEAFHPDRVASRILGMGDILSLVEEAERKIDKDKAEKIAKKIQKGKGFDLQDFLEQLTEMEKMGGLGKMMEKLPGMGQVPQNVKEQVENKGFKQFTAIINSMTLKERRFPQLIKGSRKRRIANGSGTQIQDVNRLLKQFTQMQKMMKKFSKGGMAGMMKKMKKMMPPGQMPI